MNKKDPVLMPRQSGKFIAQMAQDVFVEEKGIKKLASEVLENLKNGSLSLKNFSQHMYHPNPNDANTLNWILVIDTLNFCFWSDTDDKKWTVNEETGYFALCAAIKRAIENKIPITDSSYLSKITYNELKQILQGDNQNEISLIEERVKNLNQVGKILIEKYQGSFLECLKICDNSAEKLLRLIVEEFECFRDEAFFQNEPVSFYKRAQILIGDIWACYQGQGIGNFYDIDYITMFADYRVPQVLLYFGAIEYSDKLRKKLITDPRLESGSREEIEIRGCSIEAVENIVKEVKSKINDNPNLGFKESDCNSILIDHFLWDYRRKHNDKLLDIPYHKTKTIFY